MESLSSIGAIRRPVEDACDKGNSVPRGQEAHFSHGGNGLDQYGQCPSPLSLSEGLPLRLFSPTRDSIAPAAYVPMGLRQIDPHDRHRRGSGENDKYQPNTDTAIDGAMDAEEKASIRREQCGRAQQTGYCTPGIAKLSPHALSSQRLLQKQAPQHTGKPYDCIQMDLSFSSSQIGSLVLNSCSAILPAAGGSATGGNSGDDHCRSAFGVGGSAGDGASPPSLRHLQPPANHSHVNLFVRHLPLELNEEKLRELFNPFGEIVNSAIMRNIHTGVSLGTAFVRFSKHEEAMRAMEAFSGGRPVAGSKRMTVQWARREHDKAPAGDERRKMRKLFIRNVPKDVTQEMLMTLFSQYGPVKSVSTHRDTAAANAVSQSGGGGGAAAAEVDNSSNIGHDSATTGAGTDDRRIAFVTFEQEGVAEQATAAVHNTMPFASCQGIPLMVKLAEDTPVRHSALGGNNSRANNAGILSGAGANGNGAYALHNSSVGGGSSLGAHHPSIIVGALNNTLSWSDLPISDYTVTPITSPPTVQLHSTAGLALPRGSGRGMSLRSSGVPCISSNRSFPRAPQGSYVAQMLSPPRSFAGTTGSAGSTNETSLYTSLTLANTNSAVLPYVGQTIGSAQALRQSVHSPTPFLAPLTPPPAILTTTQHMRSCSAADATLDGSETLGSMGFIGDGSGPQPVQTMGGGTTDFVGCGGGDHAGRRLLLSLHETQEFYTMLQQCSSSLTIPSGPTAQSPLLEKPFAPTLGTGAPAHTGSSNRVNASGLPVKILGSHTDVVQSDGVASSSLPQSSNPSSTTRLSNSSFQQSRPKTLTLPQPRSGAVQQVQQRHQRSGPAGSEGGGALGGHPPAPYRLISQPRRNATANPSVPLSRSAAAAAAAATTVASSLPHSRPANTLPPDTFPASCTSTSRKDTSRVWPSCTSSSFTAGASAHHRISSAFICRADAGAEGGTTNGASNLRHGPRATSSRMHIIRGGTNGGEGGNSDSNSTVAATGALVTPLNSELVASFLSHNTNGLLPHQVTSILATGCAASCSIHGIMNSCGSSTMKYTAARPAQPANLPMPRSGSPATQSSSQHLSAELAQPVTAAVAPQTLTTAPLMEAAAKMIAADDGALATDDMDTFDYGADVTDDMYATKSHYSTLCAAKVICALGGADLPLCDVASGSSSSSVNTNSKKRSNTSAVRGQLNSPAPAATASSGAAASSLCRCGDLCDASPHSLSLGGTALLDDHLLFERESNSATTNATPGVTGTASGDKDVASAELRFSDVRSNKEFAAVLDMMPMMPESRTQDLIVVPDLSTAGSAPHLKLQLDAGDYWSAGQMRDTEKLGLVAIGGINISTAAHQVSSTAMPPPKEMSRRSTSRTLPAMTVQSPSRIGRCKDGDDEQTGRMVYPDIDLNLDRLIGPSTKSNKGGGVVGSGRSSNSSRDDVDHLVYSRQLGHAMANLYNFMSHDDASY
ncbi:RNA binding protein, putative [Leishmania tarentolae]|uniref:RNA binding protein, putative n=1 Tax=Leishmania tarentolae TaxID=5689 RepID=A0A640KN28_LEITA|nr:RNA binding protein, putative [Leishmania tarentolae]